MALVPPRNSDVGGHHLAFHVTDIAAAVDHLRAQGVTVQGDIVTMQEGPSQGLAWVYFLAPWGRQLEPVSSPDGQAVLQADPQALWSPTWSVRTGQVGPPRKVVPVLPKIMPPFCCRGGGRKGRLAMSIATHGSMAVDWEERINFDRLRTERLARVKAKLAASDMGAPLCFDMTNVRYITSTHIGTWAQDKVSRWTLLPQGAEPILWDFGSAARHHALYAPWMGGDERSRAGIPLLRGAMTPDRGRAEATADKIVREREKHGLKDQPVGVELIEPPILFALQARGVHIVDGQALMQDARVIKTRDEISLLAHAAGMVDAAYDEICRTLRPGLKENKLVGLAAKFLYDNGSE